MSSIPFGKAKFLDQPCLRWLTELSRQKFVVEKSNQNFFKRSSKNKNKINKMSEINQEVIARIVRKCKKQNVDIRTSLANFMTKSILMDTSLPFHEVEMFFYFF